MNPSQCAVRHAFLIASRDACGCAEPPFHANLPATRKYPCRTDATCSRYSSRRTEPRSWPSTTIRPLVGRLKAITRLISVLLPEPLDPTSAVVVAGRAWNDTPFSTGCPGLYSNQTSSKL